MVFIRGGPVYRRGMITWRKRIVILSAAVFGLLIVPAAAQDGRANEDALAAFFESVVFGAEYEDIAKASLMIRKWRSALRVSVAAFDGAIIDKPGGGRELKLEQQKPRPEHVQIIQKHLNALVKLTGVKTEDSKKTGEKPNFFIKFAPRSAMSGPFLLRDFTGVTPEMLTKLAAPGVCYFLTAANGGGDILWAVIIVNNQLDDSRIDACLLEEMTQALGLPNDSDLVKPSVFNNRSVRQTLSADDEILLRVLYDKRMPAGTPRPQAVKIARELIRDMEREKQ